MKLIQVNLQEEIINMAKEIQEDRHIGNFTEAIRYCIRETHERIFLDYKRLQSARQDPTKIKEKSIIKNVSKIEAEEMREQARKDKERNHAIGLCEAMGGTVLIDPTTGFESCRYTMYNMSSPWIINEHEVTESLEILNDETPSLQYQGLMNERGAEGKAVIDQARIRIAEKTGASTIKE
jgi:hypothetical protein